MTKHCYVCGVPTLHNICARHERQLIHAQNIIAEFKELRKKKITN